MKGYDSNAVGRRKTSIARVFLKEGTGTITVNGEKLEQYFPRQSAQKIVTQPLVACSKTEAFDININVVGGGKSGQAGACRHGIARAINDLLPELRAIMKPLGLMTRDPRSVERKKFGRHKARRSAQFSKR